VTNKSAKTSKALQLFLISLASLYFELLIIRWLSAEIRIFAYFKNIVLMACLFGLGLGLALAGSKRDFFRWLPLGLFLIVSLICSAGALNLHHITFTNPIEHYLIGINWDSFQASQSYWGKVLTILPGLAILVAVFYLIVATFVSMGQRIGQLFEEFSPLVAYSINVGASIVGILLFSGLSFLSLNPLAWIGIGILLLIIFFARPVPIVLFLATLAITWASSTDAVIWSPYYRIALQKVWLEKDGDHPSFHYGYRITVNHDQIQGIFDNRAETLANLGPNQRKEAVEYYDLPYKLLGDRPRDILILAAGSGNDVAAALRHGARDIDAVEIDPTIVQLGRTFHPEKPYQDARVRVTVDDARAFLKRCHKKYDLINFAYLDSHTAFSSMSSIRLDNYIYTLECFRDAARLLKPDGIMTVAFCYGATWQETRIYKTLMKALDQTPTGVWSPSKRDILFLTGPGARSSKVATEGYKLFSEEEFRKLNAAEMADWDKIEPTTDDWPFLFLRHRGMTFTYAAGLILTLCLGWRLVRRCFGGYITDAMGRTMFFLGAAFMLIEVKSVSQMGLVLGTTWLVNSAVIAGVLVMVLLAALSQMYLRVKSPDFLYILLFASLLVSYFIPLSIFNPMELAPRAVASVILLSLPILFASWIFAITFSKVKSPSAALGMNLLGTLIGGALEYLSMITGISALNLVAMALYAAAWFYTIKT